LFDSKHSVDLEVKCHDDDKNRTLRRPLGYVLCASLFALDNPSNEYDKEPRTKLKEQSTSQVLDATDSNWL